MFGWENVFQGNLGWGNVGQGYLRWGLMLDNTKWASTLVDRIFGDPEVVAQTSKLTYDESKIKIINVSH